MTIFDFNLDILSGHILSIPSWEGVTECIGAESLSPNSWAFCPNTNCLYSILNRTVLLSHS